MTITKAWLLATIEQALLVFAAGFVGALVLAGSGAFTLTAIHAALVGAGAAVLSFLQSALANLIHPAQTNVVTAVRLSTRGAQAGQITVRLLLGVASVGSGIYVLTQAAGRHALIGCGVGLILAGVGLVVP